MSDPFARLDFELESMSDTLIAERRHLHAHPEPSLEEFQTTDFLAVKLEAAGIPTKKNPNGRGLIAGPQLPEGTQRIAFRGDIDALRIHDAKDVSYKSKVEGLLHGCGHDAHAVMALGAARALWQCRQDLPWPVAWRAIFQPAEEVGAGAYEMIEAGALIDVKSIVALHVDPETLVGNISYRVGVLTAACSDLSVTIRGKGGHAARPHQAVDPIAAMAQFLTSVYSGVPRRVDSREAVVVTFGSVHGGRSANVIPDVVELSGTIRSQSFETAEKVAEIVRRIARGVADSTGTEIEIRVEGAVGPVINDERVTTICVDGANTLFGKEHVLEIALPSMGAEDFAGYLREVPGCMMRLGVACETKPRHPLHSPRFDLDERALVLGAKFLARSVILLANPGERGN